MHVQGEALMDQLEKKFTKRKKYAQLVARCVAK